MQQGTDWAAEISRWTFDEAKQYMLVAKEWKTPGTGQGVPLLDSELNEQAEILLTFVRRLIERFVGDGTTGDGFKIAQSGVTTTNNFAITGGDGTSEGAGWCFVNGWMPIIPSTIQYTAQSGVSALTTPGASNRVDEVYLDVYYAEIGPTGDADIVDPTIARETSRRIALVWKVKVAEGGSTPSDYTDANNIPHWTYKIATLNRLAGDATITTAMIVDARKAGLAQKHKEYVHSQSSAATTWTINHGLNTNYVQVEVYNTSMETIEAGVDRTSANQVVIDFGGISVAGTAVIKGLEYF